MQLNALRAMRDLLRLPSSPHLLDGMMAQLLGLPHYHHHHHHHYRRCHYHRHIVEDPEQC